MVARFLRTARNAIPYKKAFHSNRFPRCCLCLKPPLRGGAVEEEPRYQIFCKPHAKLKYTHFLCLQHPFPRAIIKPEGLMPHSKNMRNRKDELHAGRNPTPAAENSVH